MAGSVTDTDLGFDKLAKQLKKLAGQSVAILLGVHGKTHSEMVIIAASNEFGTQDGHIPERSYMRSTVDNNEGQILDDLQGAADAALGGASLDNELGLVGEKWVGEVKLMIKRLDTPPNAPSTIRQKKDTDNPLIDTGRLRNSITWTLEKGGI